MKMSRIDRHSKQLLDEATFAVIERISYPDGPLYAVRASNGNYVFNIYTGDGALFFDDEKKAIKFIKRHRGSDLRNPNSPFHIKFIDRVSIREYLDEPI